ncbi:MAG: hypothetical protein IPF72_14790 [Chitinophagaceae bacterium]|nr:hypothetical protein [Chitinophagaceae bacterium]
MDSGKLKNENNGLEQNIFENETEVDIDAQIDILASVIIEILLKDLNQK